MYRQWVPCNCNSSYYFIPVFLKLRTCFLQGLQMCMCFDIIFELISVTFFLLCELFHFMTSDFMKVYRLVCGYLLSTTSHTWYENRHVLLMKFLYIFPLPEINITLFGRQMQDQLHESSIYIFVFGAIIVLCFCQLGS